MLQCTATWPISPHLQSTRTGYAGPFTCVCRLSFSISLPVALDLLTALLDVSEAAAGVALLLVGVVTIARHVTGLAAVVAQLLALLLGLLAVSGDVTSSAAVVAGCRKDHTCAHLSLNCCDL